MAIIHSGQFVYSWMTVFFVRSAEEPPPGSSGVRMWTWRAAIVSVVSVLVSVAGRQLESAEVRCEPLTRGFRTSEDARGRGVGWLVMNRSRFDSDRRLHHAYRR